MSGDVDSGDEVIDAAAHNVGVSAATQRGAVVGLELIMPNEFDEHEERGR